MQNAQERAKLLEFARACKEINNKLLSDSTKNFAAIQDQLYPDNSLFCSDQAKVAHALSQGQTFVNGVTSKISSFFSSIRTVNPLQSSFIGVNLR